MPLNYYDIAFTDSVKKEQAEKGSLGVFDSRTERFEQLGENERNFIAQRDSFYMATVGETGWPYLQHRGGPKGFIRFAGKHTLAIADFRGNRQYISIGNLAGDNRSALFMMDYVNRTRLKLYAHVTAVSIDDAPDLAALIETSGYRGKVERILKFDIAGYDWNCPQHIVERYTLSDVEDVTRGLRERIVELEAQVETLKSERGI